MPTNRRRRSRARSIAAVNRPLTFYEWLELVIGPGDQASQWPTDDARRQAWEWHRAEITVQRRQRLGADVAPCWAGRRYDRMTTGGDRV